MLPPRWGLRRRKQLRAEATGSVLTTVALLRKLTEMRLPRLPDEILFSTVCGGPSPHSLGESDVIREHVLRLSACIASTDFLIGSTHEKHRLEYAVSSSR